MRKKALLFGRESDKIALRMQAAKAIDAARRETIAMEKKEVLVLFKTHLDIGFTDYAKNIVEKYINEFIPAAIRVGYELKDTETPFRWTTGSYLIWEALKRDKT